MMRFSPVRLELSLLSIHNNFSASLEIQHVTGKGRLTLCFSITHVSCVECCEADECSILDGRHWEILFKSQNCMLPYFCRDVQNVCGSFSNLPDVINACHHRQSHKTRCDTFFLILSTFSQISCDSREPIEETENCGIVKCRRNPIFSAMTFSWI